MKIFRLSYCALILPVLLAGCSSTPAVQESKDPIISTVPVNGQGTPADRSAINSSNQQIFNSEHSMSSGTPANSTQGIP